MAYYVYIMTNHRATTLYIGATSDLERRVYEPKKKLGDGFTKKYNLGRLVYFEETDDVQAAFERERQLKGWLRRRKAALVETMNPNWRDLSADWSRSAVILRLRSGLPELVQRDQRCAQGRGFVP